TMWADITAPKAFLRHSHHAVRVTCVWVSVLPLNGLNAHAADLRLIEAVQRQDTAAIRALVKAHIDVNMRQPDGTTALHWAAEAGDAETVGLLIQAGARTDLANAFGVTPL